MKSSNNRKNGRVYKKICGEIRRFRIIENLVLTHLWFFIKNECRYEEDLNFKSHTLFHCKVLPRWKVGNSSFFPQHRKAPLIQYNRSVRTKSTKTSIRSSHLKSIRSFWPCMFSMFDFHSMAKLTWIWVSLFSTWINKQKQRSIRGVLFDV